MPFDATGDLTRIHSWVFDKNAGIKIIASRMDDEFDNIVSAINDILQGNSPFKASIKGPFGTAGAPTFAFKDDAGTGVFRHGADELGISAGGTTSARFTATGPAFGDGQDIKAYIDSRGFAGPPTIQSFTGNGSNVNFTLAAAPVSENALLVTVAGVVQHHDAFSVASDVLTFTAAPGSGAAIEVMDLSSHAVIDTVAVQTVVQNMAAITDAPNQATAAANSATAAAASETNAGNSASAAAASASGAATSETNAGSSAAAAATSETNAGASASAASTSETNAGTSETNAGNSAAASAASATAAATSETNAGGSAAASATSASNAATSETNAGNSATAAAAAQTAAEAAQSGAEAAEATAIAKAAEAAASAGVGPALAGFARAQYSIATRAPSVIVDPITNLYMRAAGPCSFSDLITHVRNSAAVFTDGDGAIVSSPSGTPRLDHHVLKDGMFQRAGLRVDTQATNLFAGSDDPAEWSVPGNMEVDTEVGIGSGGGSLFRMRGATGGSGSLRLGINAYANAVTLNTLQCFSFDARADGLNRVRFSTGSDGPGIDPATVWDVSTGDVIATGSSVIRAGIYDLGGGLFRCFTVWQSSATDGSVTFAMQLCLNTTTSSTGSSAIPVDPSSSVIVGNFQHEEGVGAPSSYIKTTTAAVTRAADTLSIANANLPDAAPAYTFVFEGTIDRADTGSAEEAVLFNWHIGANTEQVKLVMNSSGANDGLPELFGVAGGASASAAGAGVGLGQEGIGVEFRIALAVTATSLQVVMNGAAGTAVTHANGLPDLSTADIDLAQNFNGTLSRMRIFDIALPEAALITETTL